MPCLPVSTTGDQTVVQSATVINPFDAAYAAAYAEARSAAAAMCQQKNPGGGCLFFLDAGPLSVETHESGSSGSIAIRVMLTMLWHCTTADRFSATENATAKAMKCGRPFIVSGQGATPQAAKIRATQSAAMVCGSDCPTSQLVPGTEWAGEPVPGTHRYTALFMCV